MTAPEQRAQAGSLEGLIDFHLHAGPDVRPRKASYLEIAAAARAAGMAGVVFKSHVTCTADLAALAAQATPGLAAYGGLVLNQEVGGFNPAAVEAALKMGARQIWMPTLSARHHRRTLRVPGSGLSITDRRGKIRSTVRDIIALIRESGAILGTGHLAIPEIRLLVETALGMGARKVLITHADFHLTALPLDAQRELSIAGVFFERCYSAIGRGASWDHVVAAIRAAGVEHSVLATDLGQPDNPSPPEGLAELVTGLLARGFTRAEIAVMGRQIPLRLLEESFLCA